MVQLTMQQLYKYITKSLMSAADHFHFITLVLTLVLIKSISGLAQENARADTVANEVVQQDSSSTQQSYIVKDGDTFWDLAFEFKGDPYEWPQMWEKNQHIKNPHLIYPGDVVMISGTGDSIGSFPTDQQVTENQKNSSPGAVHSFQSGRQVRVSSAEFPLSTKFFSSVPFLWTQRDSSGYLYPGDGIVNKPTNKESYHLHDVFSFKLLKGASYSVGDTVAVYLSERFVRFKNSPANMIRRVGKARITSIEKKRGFAQLFEMSAVIKGKERVGRFYEPAMNNGYQLVKPDTVLTATVFERTEQTPSPYLFQTVILDKGTHQGVRVGDIFAVYHKENETTARYALTGYVAFVTEESASLVIMRISENKVAQGDPAFLLSRSIFTGGQ